MVKRQTVTLQLIESNQNYEMEAFPFVKAYQLLLLKLVII